jgi:hypothetical protein
VEPLNLDKSADWEHDAILIKSVMHLAKTDIPSFRHITRRAQAEKIVANITKANKLAEQYGLQNRIPEFTSNDLIKQAIEKKIQDNVQKINNIVKELHKAGKAMAQEAINKGKRFFIQHRTDPNKRFEVTKNDLSKIKKALTAGYGGAGAPTDATGGAVLQSESLNMGRGFKYITCDDCGEENIYMKHQTKCRKCHKSYPFYKLAKLLYSKT